MVKIIFVLMLIMILVMPVSAQMSEVSVMHEVDLKLSGERDYSSDVIVDAESSHTTTLSGVGDAHLKSWLVIDKVFIERPLWWELF